VSEKAWVAAGLAQEQDGAPAHGFGVMAALRDPVVMVFAAVNFLNLGAYYAFNLSAPVLLGQATGLDDARVGYLVALGGAAAALAMLGNGWLSDRSGERYGHLAVPLGACAAAMALLRLTHQPGLVVAAFVLASCGNAAVAAVFWLAPSERIAPARMAVSVPAINCLGIVSAFLTPYVWGVVRDMTGNYRLGLSVLPIAYGLAAVLVLAMRPRRARA